MYLQNNNNNNNNNNKKKKKKKKKDRSKELKPKLPYFLILAMLLLFLLSEIE
jgi:hypothetical protein